jgi:hypothetical protein
MKNKKLIILGSLSAIIILWALSWIFIDILFPSGNEDYLADRGTFGDKFGFINSLFSGLALTGIIISIYFQQYELSLQRQELSETRKEFKDQNFQTTFFNLLKTQRQLAEEIDCYIWNLRNYQDEEFTHIKGRNFFNISKLELERIINALKSKNYSKYHVWDQGDDHEYGPNSEWEADNLTESRKILYTFHIFNINKEIFDSSKSMNENQIASLAFQIFYNKYSYVFGHYFRHLYHILNFLENYKKELDENSIEDISINNFVNFIQAQMSIPELFLLYYNCYKFPKSKRLIIKFNILENLNEEDLISAKHKIENINLKSRKIII